MKRIVRLTESDLTRIVKRVLTESTSEGKCIKGNCQGGYGHFLNKNGRLFKGQFTDLLNGYFKKSETEDNKQYEGLFIWEDLDKVKKDENINTKSCKNPFSNGSINFKYTSDKNYEYNRGDYEEGFCWWAKNIKNGKFFNLSDLAKTNPKIQSSINNLNRNTERMYV